MPSQKREPKGSLATGPTRRWTRSKPQLAAALPENAPNPSIPPSARNAFFLVKIAAILLSTMILVVLASWALLSLTVIPTPRLNGDPWVIQRAANAQGQDPPGTTVFLLPTSADLGYLERLQMMADKGKDNSIVMVMANPYTTIKTGKNGALVVNGKTTDYTLDQQIEKTRLDNQYLAVCLLGDCGPPGTPIVIATDRVLGKVLGSLNLSGLGPLPKQPTPEDG